VGADGHIFVSDNAAGGTEGIMIQDTNAKGVIATTGTTEANS